MSPLFQTAGISHLLFYIGKRCTVFLCCRWQLSYYFTSFNILSGVVPMRVIADSFLPMSLSE